MKAILTRNDGSLDWADVSDPILLPGEVLVKVHYAALNRADLMQRAGDYPPPEGCPEWMGLEVSGTIEEMTDQVRENSRWSVGDRVCALLGGGGYAQKVAVRHDMLMPVPSGCTMAEAAAMPEAFATTYLNLFLEGGAKKGDTLLVTAGASGLASVMIPMAKAFGLKVITTVRKPEQAKAIAGLGADRIVVTTGDELSRVMKEELDSGHGVDIAIDCLGGNYIAKNLQYMERGGRWIIIAALAGDVVDINLKTMYKRSLRIIGNTLRSRSPEVKADILSRIVRDVWPKVESNEVRPTVFKVLPVSKAEEAHAILMRGENVGKVVLDVIENGGASEK